MARSILALGFSCEEISEDGYDIIPVTLEERIPQFEDFDIIIINVGVFFLPQKEGRTILESPTLTEEGRKIKQVERAIEKDVINSLEDGKIICFIAKNIKDELFKRIMQKSDVGLGYIDNEFTDLNIKRSEFTPFLKEFGIGDMGFNEEVDDIICEKYDYVLGFSKRYKKGNLVVVPSKPSIYQNRIESLLSTLTECLISYSARLTDNPPEWVDEFEFSEESVVKANINRLEEELEDERQKLTKYDGLKSILWVGNNELVENVMNFFDKIDLETERDEIYEEDFWIVDKGNKEVIVEIKGKANNIVRPDISRLDEHRGARKKPDDFPALLIGNTFISADSLDRKETDISPNEIEKAARNNVLILRTIDFCYLYKLIEKDKINPEKILNIFQSEIGWLKVEEENYEIKTG